MRTAFSTIAILLALCGSAQADTCGDLVNTAKAALSMEGLDQSTRDQLQELMRAGRSGDATQCEKATGSIFQSSPEGERAPVMQRCNEMEKSV
jgi:hypothetical protein